MADLGVGGVLADDMGLGKTIQVLALHLARRDRRPPDPRRLPGVGPRPTGNGRRPASPPACRSAATTGRVGTSTTSAADEIVVATYGVVRRDAEALAAVGWGLVVADEAQAVKNPNARTARALRRIPGDARFALTGTPVENRLTELWAILDWTTPGLLGPLERLPDRRGRSPSSAYQDEEVAGRARAGSSVPSSCGGRRATPPSPPTCRRRPRSTGSCPLTVEQATLYRAVTDEVLAQIEVGRRHRSPRAWSSSC